MSLIVKDTTMRDGKLEEITVAQGEFHVSDSPNLIVKTLLGSCVATCLYDPVTKVGGMNHFLLATGPDHDTNLGEIWGLRNGGSDQRTIETWSKKISIGSKDLWRSNYVRNNGAYWN